MWLRSFLGSFLALFGLGTLVFFAPDITERFLGHANGANKLNKLLDLLMRAPEYYLTSQDSFSPTQKNCLYYNCFDVYKCGGNHRKILVHISQPLKVMHGSPEAKEVSLLTKEFVDILEAIVESDFYTEDPQEACIFVPAFNLITEANLDPILSSKALAKMPNWNNGINNLLFTLVSGNPDALRLEHGSAMVAGAGLSSFSYRNKYDVALPLYTTIQEEQVQQQEKSDLLVVIQGSEIHPKLLSWADNLKNNPGVKVFHPDKDEPLNEHSRTDEKGRKFSTLEVLSKAKYCLVAKEKSGRLSTPFLMASLHAGCVPIILIDNLVLPFSEVIDWKLFSIRFYEHDFDQVHSFLANQISTQRYSEMKAQVDFIYKTYFKDLQVITKTTLQIINDRVFSQHAKTYTDWNFPRTFQQSPIFMKNQPPASEGFTAVILTYDRLDSLYQVIKSVAEAPSLSMILVVWNNQLVEPPPLANFPNINKPIKVIKTEANLLTNRFFPFDDIKTEAVLSIDDDIVMLTSDELEFAYQVWREFPDRLVGFPSRTHVWNNQSKQWKYESEWTNDVSMVLTGAAFYHKYWHYLFTANPSEAGKEIKTWLDQRMNCEDIAMNFLIANATGKAPIKVTPRKKFKCSTPQCNNVDMLSNYQGHLIERSECVNYLVEKYGYMPLKKAEFRADPVLFKDKFPERLKNYVNIGSL